MTWQVPLVLFYRGRLIETDLCTPEIELLNI